MKRRISQSHFFVTQSMVFYNHKVKEAGWFRNDKGGITKMKGYYTANGFYGLVAGSYLLFSDESDYYEYVETEDAA